MASWSPIAALIQGGVKPHAIHPPEGKKCKWCVCRESEEADPGKAPGETDGYYQDAKDGLGR